MPATTDRLPPPVRDEISQARALHRALLNAAAAATPAITPTDTPPALEWSHVIERAQPWVEAVRRHPAPFWALESLLREYPISSSEGLALMRLAEALLRVPDTDTAVALTADQLGRGHFEAHDGRHSAHPLFGRLAAQAVELSRKLLPADGSTPGLLQRLGGQTVVAAAVRSVQLLGQQFVLGQDIGEALRHADKERGDQHRSPAQLRYSFDMLGEGARTDADAAHYLAAYRQAIQAIAATGRPDRPENGDGISIKLSALDARFEAAQHSRVMQQLVPRVLTLVDAAAAANLNLTLDAEETERLELSLDVLDALAAHVARQHPRWQGLGLALQAYQLRAPDMVAAVAELAHRHHLRLMVRLVKGAYWDAEIKRAQELGLAGYPVWTHKAHTDLAYLSCARALLGHQDVIYPQFASHNAGTIAAILQMADEQAVRTGLRPAFELQRLHGMGIGVYREVLKHPEAPPLRIYAPVGRHRDLLAYLVRRLLENGANSSFVHQLADETVSAQELLASPLQPHDAPGLISPRQLYGPQRLNALGLDLNCAAQRAPLEEAIRRTRLSATPDHDRAAAEAAMQRLAAAQPAWNATPLAERCAVLRRAADALEARLAEFCALLVVEGRKTMGDALAEVREAIDFCRYYAQQAEARLATQLLPGPTGESNELRLHGRGVFICISPWNFPLAIYAGQVVAALVAGNAVAAKPAEQTPAVADAFAALLFDAGLPRDALAVLRGPGETVGAALVAHPLCAGVCFTGSTQVAKLIQRQLAMSDGPIVPLIAETGGLNTMVVDSSALPEQVVDAVVQSAFRSAGQRCSALRLLCVHEDIAAPLLEMLAGAMQTLVLGDPADWATDVGPVIDAEAHAGIQPHLRRLDGSVRLIARTPLPAGLAASHIAPVAYELKQVGELRDEIFGPVLHVVRWRGAVDALVAQINALGYGLTLGVHTRIDSRAERIAAQARIGNVYVNRNMIGAVVGVQPFGGEGLSGTGPKAGGPHYLYRFCTEQTVTVNTAAAGGNVQLLAGVTSNS